MHADGLRPGRACVGRLWGCGWRRVAPMKKDGWTAVSDASGDDGQAAGRIGDLERASRTARAWS